MDRDAEPGAERGGPGRVEGRRARHREAHAREGVGGRVGERGPRVVHDRHARNHRHAVLPDARRGEVRVERLDEHDAGPGRERDPEHHVEPEHVEERQRAERAVGCVERETRVTEHLPDVRGEVAVGEHCGARRARSARGVEEHRDLVVVPLHLDRHGRGRRQLPERDRAREPEVGRTSRTADERVRLDDPLAVARRWRDAGFARLHVVDLDAATGRGANDAVVDALLAQDAAAILAVVDALAADGADMERVLAELLGIPHSTIIMEVQVDGSTLKVKRELEGGWFQWISMPLPAAITIHRYEWISSFIRVPTTAQAMPISASSTPRRAVSALPRPRRPVMNRNEAAK